MFPLFCYCLFFFAKRQAKFLLQPRTQEELLVFCRKKLGLQLPADLAVTTLDTDAPSPPQSHIVRKTGADGAVVGSSSVADRLDNSAVATELARTVLAWGRPFRSVETTWRSSALGQGYAVISRFPRPVPNVPIVVLCSSDNMLRGKVSPLLGPGTVGEPFAADVTVESIKWLKDQWDAK